MKKTNNEKVIARYKKVIGNNTIVGTAYKFEYNGEWKDFFRVVLVSNKTKNEIGKGKYSSSRTVAEKYFARMVEKEELKVKRAADRKAKKDLVKNNFTNPAKVGDIYYTSWGYEQTNIDFYQVVKVSEKSVWFRAVYSNTVENAGYMSSYVEADKDNFRGETFRTTWKHSAYGNSHLTYKSKYLGEWDGKPKLETSYA